MQLCGLPVTTAEAVAVTSVVHWCNLGGSSVTQFKSQIEYHFLTKLN